MHSLQFICKHQLYHIVVAINIVTKCVITLLTNKSMRIYGNSADKLRHLRSAAYSVELVPIKAHVLESIARLKVALRRDQ